MALSRRLGGNTIFICAAGLLLALAGLSGCGSSADNAAQNAPPSFLASGSASGASGSASGSSGAASPSSSCSTSAFMHRTGQVRGSQRATLTAALVPADIPDPGLDLDGRRPEVQENELQQEHQWDTDGINNAGENPQTSQPGNSVQQESTAVAETEEVTLWETDLTESATFGADVCDDIETLMSDAKHLDDLNKVCAAILQVLSTKTPFGAVCGVVQDASNKFDQVFPCNDLQVAQWMVDTLSDVFCVTTAAPSG